MRINLVVVEGDVISDFVGTCKKYGIVDGHHKVGCVFQQRCQMPEVSQKILTRDFASTRNEKGTLTAAKMHD